MELIQCLSTGNHFSDEYTTLTGSMDETEWNTETSATYSMETMEYRNKDYLF